MRTYYYLGGSIISQKKKLHFDNKISKYDSVYDDCIVYLYVIVFYIILYCVTSYNIQHSIV